MKKTIALLGLAVAIAMPSFNTVKAEQVSTTIEAYYAPVQFEFDGSYLAPPSDQRGFIYQGSTYVPLRFVAYALDKAVEWNPDTYTVTIRKPGKAEQVTIDEYKMNRKTEKLNGSPDLSALHPTSLAVYFENVKYVFDGTSKQPSDDLPGMIIEGSVYVPLKFVSESVGRKIEWDPATYTVKAAIVEASPKPSTSPSPTPTPSATPAPAGGTGGGGGVSKPSQSTLFFQVVLDLEAMERKAQSTMDSYKTDYAAAETAEEKAAIEAKARAYYSEVESQFNSRVNTYESQLNQNGYDTSSVNELKNAFQDKVDQKKAEIGQ
ncbi:copper amine oxidase N-terminal domain-containing protein [Paenibacillus mesotrionivorans]|uniref:Copper amine oxidase N-terminal domain-containing protein n=1 Tax=Paenibacillus mesotrionivorans TaxID=3160968 RepID=A0ACC7NXE9_9BACL